MSGGKLSPMSVPDTVPDDDDDIDRTCSFSENERDDELVTNPFADSSGGKDSAWNPSNESENMSHSNCITKLCVDKGV
ncbi:hypothetical protein PoB_000374200 [Plakobranchus ocellatus]|uniref:Uncharacterized protein n=1 Tax=Plakobranchus ocellatus TaxID=259542 RepID=A0AAV3Y3C2_9GAST|nr:hypothetical protein PoB_000374200 [Plakobranchus ocellatus]